jgi:hypothetical protein
MYPKSDDNFQEHTITRVDGSKEDGWSVNFDTCMGIGVPSDSPVVPEPGMTLRLYSKGFGFTVRGMFIDGQKVYYRTEEEDEEHRRQQVEESKRERRAQFEKDRADLDRKYDALPAIFRARIDKFRRNNPDFRWEYEGYEMFTCEQAVVFADTFKTPEALREWAELPWEEQHKRCPGMSDGHSGNTFGMACRLALDYLSKPENVEKRHGALAPLVGSQEYGCVPRDA